jgi:hypothetical protein
VSCPICHRNVATVGLLCETCRDAIADPPMAPELIVSHGIDPTPAALVDSFGRGHALEADTKVGRAHQVLTILDSTVSRLHATIALDHGAWIVSDLGSERGTFVGERRVTSPALLFDGERVRFGRVAFYFLEELFARTRTGRPTMAFRFHEPTGGGGGVIEIDGKQLQLTIAQLELLHALVDRMLADEGIGDDDDRGFVQVSALVHLSLNTAMPGVEHVRQVIRRLRRAFIKAGIGDLIESRHGLGYRLRVLPRLHQP